MKELSRELLRTIDIAELQLQKISDMQSSEPVLRGGWSRKQVIGHLIDSASNNHQRFVRASLESSLDFPAYDQDGWVRVQSVEGADWRQMLSLWSAYNRYLAHVIAHLPPTQLETLCRIGTAEPVTLRFLASDYLRHLLHHLGQIGAADSL